MGYITRAFLFVFLALTLSAASVTVTGPLYMPDGVTPANGTVTVAWPNFNGSDGHYTPAGSRTFTVTNGAFTTLLQPSTVSSPHFSYKVTYKFGSATPPTCSWVVPITNSTIPDIETCPTPASSVP